MINAEQMKMQVSCPLEKHPTELELEVEHQEKHVTYLEINITMENGNFFYELFNKKKR